MAVPWAGDLEYFRHFVIQTYGSKGLGGVFTDAGMPVIQSRKPPKPLQGLKATVVITAAPLTLLENSNLVAVMLKAVLIRSSG